MRVGTVKGSRVLEESYGNNLGRASLDVLGLVEAVKEEEARVNSSSLLFFSNCTLYHLPLHNSHALMYTLMIH